MYDTTNLEYSVVGALCIEPSIAKKLFGKVLPDDFTVDACAAVVEAAFEADVRGKAFDYVLAAEAARPLLSTTDPQRFIVECMELTPTIANAELHAEMIHKAAKRRKLLEAIEEASLEEDPEALASQIMSVCRNTLGSGNGDRTYSLSNVLIRMYTEMDKPQLRIDTGFARTDAILKGMWGGNLCVLGARPGVGKTAFALSIAMSAARRGHKVLMYSLEMLADELAERALAQQGIEMNELIDGKRDSGYFTRLNKASSSIAGLPIVICDDPSITTGRIRAQALRTEGVELIVVDFLTLMRSERKFDNRNLEVGAISRELKLLASELQIPILVLAQLSRNKDEDETPTLRDLRDSGEIEQNANKVMLLWNADKENNMVGLYIAKNRRGATGQVCFRFDGAHMAFHELPHPVPQKKAGTGRKVF